MASSVVVERGQWRLCEDANYGGRCLTLRPGSYASRGQFGRNDAISSARPNGGGGRRPGDGGGGRDQVTLYEGFSHTGRSYTFDRGMFNLDTAGFNDRARSAIVTGGTWVLCEDAAYGRTCHIYGPGNDASLGELSGRASSLRQNDGSSSGGGYPPGWGGRVRPILFEAPGLAAGSSSLTATVSTT